MIHSDFFRMDVVNDKVAEGCDPQRDEHGHFVGWKKSIHSYPPIGSPDGGTHVTADDLDRFLREVKAGALLSPHMTSAFFTPQVLHHVEEEWKHMFGYGIEFGVDDTGKVIFAEKEGHNAGVSALLRHYSEQDINVIILANIINGAWEPRKMIHGMLLSDKEAGELSL
jgi:hypothetical protein